VSALQEFARRLGREETRRKTIQDDGTVVVGEELRHVDCLTCLWAILRAAADPRLNPKTRAVIEQELRRLVGDGYVDLLKARAETPQRPRSMNEMHALMREMVQSGAVDIMRENPETPIGAMYDAPSNPVVVANTRHDVEALAATVQR